VCNRLDHSRLMERDPSSSCTSSWFRERERERERERRNLVCMRRKWFVCVRYLVRVILDEAANGKTKSSLPAVAPIHSIERPRCLVSMNSSIFIIMRIQLCISRCRGSLHLFTWRHLLVGWLIVHAPNEWKFVERTLCTATIFFDYWSVLSSQDQQ